MTTQEGLGKLPSSHCLPELNGGREQGDCKVITKFNKVLSQDCSTLGAERHPFIWVWKLSASCRKTAGSRERSADDNSIWCMPGTVPIVSKSFRKAKRAFYWNFPQNHASRKIRFLQLFINFSNSETPCLLYIYVIVS